MTGTLPHKPSVCGSAVSAGVSPWLLLEARSVAGRYATRLVVFFCARLRHALFVWAVLGLELCLFCGIVFSVEFWADRPRFEVFWICFTSVFPE